MLMAAALTPARTSLITPLRLSGRRPPKNFIGIDNRRDAQPSRVQAKH
jgi:hypothetical protein